MKTPWTQAREKRHVKQEKRLDELHEGKKGVNSGRHWRWKRDGKMGAYLIECRDTQHRSFSISYDEFQTITKEAHKTPPGLLPAMQVDILDLSLFVMRLVDHEDREMRLAALEEDVYPT
jgi:hypothetical protein